jgi:membrane-associated phospholipid phosphatase
LALDVHFLTDVLAGWALGAAWVMLCAALLRPLPRLGPWRTAKPS